MISIHLRRTGASKDPHYRVVVADSRDARDGAFIEVLGHYHPRFEPARVVLDVQKTKAWIEKGAQPSDTVKSLLKRVESGAVDLQTSVAPSRHRDAVKHAARRAAAPAAAAEEVEAAAPATEAAEESAATEETTGAEEPGSDDDAGKE